MFTHMGYHAGYHMGEQIRKEFFRMMGGQLRQRESRVKSIPMPIENKTEKIVMRVKPSYKRRAEVIADVLGFHVVELFEEALKSYEATPKVRALLNTQDVRDALAKASHPASEEGS